ncbi:DUF1272 domain-containing protein [Flavobacteriaceae bacterium]|nr:DUF1272 domain-containing protein [Flavobacteriaceae bacterium]
MRSVCEHCNKALPPDSGEAMICAYECTFCSACVESTLNHKCPNCGGTFEKRPVKKIT